MFLIILVDAVKDSMAALLYQPVKAAAPSAAMLTKHAYSISSEMPQIRSHVCREFSCCLGCKLFRDAVLKNRGEDAFLFPRGIKEKQRHVVQKQRESPIIARNYH